MCMSVCVCVCVHVYICTHSVHTEAQLHYIVLHHFQSELESIRSSLLYLHPNIVCSKVMKPEATNNVPVSSLLPTLSPVIQMAGLSKIGMVKVAKNIDM